MHTLTEDVRGLNEAFLLKLRDAAHKDIGAACFIYNVEPEVAKTLAAMPIDRVRLIARQSEQSMIGLRFPAITWRKMAAADAPLVDLYSILALSSEPALA
jgi:hypothetical protein